MAATYAAQAPGEGLHPDLVPGAYKDIYVTVTGDSSYPTGGYALGVANMPVPAMEINQVMVANPWFDTAASPKQGFVAVWDNANNKVLAMAQATAGAADPLVDVTATTNLSAYTCTLRVSFR